MKIFFRNIHLYLGLASGLIIMTTCFTGAMLVFEEELMHAFNKERYYVKPAAQRLSADMLINNFKTAEANATVNSIKFYTDPNRSAEISFTESSKQKANDPKSLVVKKDALNNEKKGQQQKQGGGEGVRKTAFMNPYSGELLALFNYRESFFFTMFSVHRWLLSGDTGKLIVGIASAIFLFILITGIILWWPKTKRILAKRLTIKRNVNWKRLNHDFHIVLGFYTAIFLFIFAFTGLAWSFEWFNKGIYTITNSNMQRPEAPASTIISGSVKVSVDAIMSNAIAVKSEVHYYNIQLPKDSAAAYTVSFLSNDAPHESATDQVYFDQYNGKQTGTNYYRDRNLGSRVRATFKPVHTGSIFGLSSKIIAFVVCLLGVSFPVTGTIMWINRIRKKARPIIGTAVVSNIKEPA